MASGDRFYQLELSHRPAFWGDIGSLLKIEGIVIGGQGAQGVLMLPSAYLLDEDERFRVTLTPEEWSEWLRQSDNPEILVNGSLEKAFHRKLRYDISGHVQQKVWAADGFKCVYCSAPMGRVQLSIDHFYPLEQGGKNDASNFLSACRACNKKKGAMDPKVWCANFRPQPLSFDYYVEYLKNRKIA